MAKNIQPPRLSGCYCYDVHTNTQSFLSSTTTHNSTSRYVSRAAIVLYRASRGGFALVSSLLNTNKTILN